MNKCHSDSSSGNPGKGAGAPGIVSKVIDELCSGNTGVLDKLRLKPTRHLAPSRDRLIEIMENLRSILFPGYFGPTDLTEETVKYYLGSILDETRRMLEDQLGRGYCFDCKQDCCRILSEDCISRAKTATEHFLLRLPEIRRLLNTDVQAAYEGDPAATSPDETIFCYPGLLAITNHRVAHEFYRIGVPLIPRIISEYAHSITGIDIHPGATIGEKFFIDHGTGVVVGETSKIGRNVRIYQGVTLGAVSFPLDENGNPIKGIDRHPVVEDDVMIYSGATILGRVTIGRSSIIGGNVWLTRDVPANSRITQRQPRLTGFNGQEKETAV